MRKDLLHFLLTVKEERVMYSMISNMNKEDLITLFQYLSYTSWDIQERWHTVYERLMDFHSQQQPINGLPPDQPSS
ncbi:MAG TPA: hypothetical protein VMS09_19620 [Paenibacillus sp.]|uniref:hypothetical protein n=1 Tax=Paenibacillus sp. TaxID=58172 RepID=UPI002C407CE0|nr:hypothetical protein [Paenibacillus sp.]HUC94192.1 hypothetical protein [Paenibacillus sp.]